MTSENSFDYIIVGAGASGCVVAHRLSEDPNCKVLLLEAGGPDEDPNIHNLDGFIKLWGTDYDWQFLSEPQPALNDRRIFITQGKVLGGGSSVHAMMYVRGNRRNYDQWQALGNPGWGYREILPYFEKSEDYVGGEKEFRASGGLLSVRNCPTLSPVAEAFLKGAAELGYSQGDGDFNGAVQENKASVMQFNITIDNERASSATAFLTPILSRPNLTVKTKAMVSKVLFEGKKAIGVEYYHQGQTWQAKSRREVVLSGGAFLSPKLLMLSGIGPASHLQSLGIPVVQDLAGVGQNLQDHMRLQVIFKSKRQLPLPVLLCETSLFVHSQGAKDAPPDIQINFSSGIPGFPPPEYAQGIDGPFSIFVPILAQPHSRGEVKLRSANPQDPPIIDPKYLSNEADLQIYLRAIALCREIAGTSAFADFNDGEIAPGHLHGDEAYIRKYAETIWHPAGTCRMGKDNLSVVDPQLRVHGVEGLRVIDASIMPNVTSGNTYAPAVMIGEKGSDLLLGKTSFSTVPKSSSFSLGVKPVSKKILAILSEWGYWGEELVGPYDVLRQAGYTIDFATAHGRKPPALPPSMDENYVDPPLDKYVTDAHFAQRTREVDGSDLLGNPINLAEWFPGMPYFNSPNFGHELESYYNKRAEAWKDLEKYDALLLPGGSGPMVDMVNNERVHDVILGFLAQNKLIAAECYCVTCLAFARDWTDRKSIIWGKHVTGHAREYDYKDGTGFAQMYGYDGQPMNTSANFGPPFYPLEYILRDAVGPEGQYHGGVGHSLSTILDYPFLTGRSTQDSKLVGELMIQALEQGLKRY
ncbi:MAG: GMC family oxidoreductase N-terminal domain-containing protein, partial [Microcystaceae cyanobacterium]